MKLNDFKPFLFFCFYAVLLIIPFIGLFNLFDWDEINFAESSREMILSDNFFQVMINFEPFHEKPPLYFWLQVLSMKIFGVSSFAARFPNALLSVFVPLIIFNIGTKLKNRNFGWVWSIIFLSGFLPNLYFRSGIIDPYFNLFIFLSIYFFHLYTLSNPSKNIIISGLFSGLAILTKGPVGLLIVIISSVFYLISIRKPPLIRHLVLFIIPAVIISSPWYVFELVHKGPWFIIEFIQYQIELFSVPVAGHKQPLYYHFVVLLIGCMPFSLFALSNTYKKSGSEISFERIMRIVLWTVLILFTVVTTKIIHYSSMAYVPLSFLAAIEIYKIMNGKDFNKLLKFFLLSFGITFSLLLAILLYLLIFKKSILINYIPDPNIQVLLALNLNWRGWEWLIPLILVFANFIWLRKPTKNYIKSLAIYSVLIGFTFSLISCFIIPKVDSAIQGSVISFYKDISKEKKYVTTVGFKSYAHYFYAEIDKLSKEDQLFLKKDEILEHIFSVNSLNDLNRQEKYKFNNQVLDWLIDGNVDRPVYFVARKRKPIYKLNESKNLKLIKDFGGYQFYKRELK